MPGPGSLWKLAGHLGLKLPGEWVETPSMRGLWFQKDQSPSWQQEAETAETSQLRPQAGSKESKLERTQILTFSKPVSSDASNKSTHPKPPQTTPPVGGQYSNA